MGPPLGSQPARTRPTATASRSMLTSDSCQFANTSGQTTFRTHQSPRSIDLESPGEPREADNLRTAPNPSQRLPDEPVCGYAMFPRFPVAGSGLGHRNPRAQNASLAFGVCHSALLLTSREAYEGSCSPYGSPRPSIRSSG